MAVQNIMYQGISFLATVKNGFIQLVKVSGQNMINWQNVNLKGSISMCGIPPG